MSISVNEIKKVRSLSEKKFRDRLGLFCVEGEKMVEESLRSGFEVETVYRKDEIGEEAMSRISALSSPSPVLAVVRKPLDISIKDNALLSSCLGKSGLYLALDTIRDPGNLGTILRVADWFGIDAVFAAPDTVDVFNPKVVQATMGAARLRFPPAAMSMVHSWTEPTCMQRTSILAMTPLPLSSSAMNPTESRTMSPVWFPTVFTFRHILRTTPVQSR